MAAVTWSVRQAHGAETALRVETAGEEREEGRRREVREEEVTPLGQKAGAHPGGEKELPFLEICRKEEDVTPKDSSAWRSLEPTLLPTDARLTPSRKQPPTAEQFLISKDNSPSVNRLQSKVMMQHICL